MIHIRSFSALRPLWRAILLLIVSLCDQCFRKGGCVTAECFLRHAMRTNHKRIILTELSQSFRATTTAPQPREPFKEFCLLKFWEVIKFRCYRLVTDKWKHVSFMTSWLWRSGRRSKQFVVSSHSGKFFFCGISISCDLGKIVMNMSIFKVRHQLYLHDVS